MNNSLRLIVVLSLLVLPATEMTASPIEDGKAAYRNQNWQLAHELLRPLAQLGQTAASLRLGLMYRDGQGTPADTGKAIDWFRKATLQSDADAQLGLGFSHQNAVYWFHKWANEGDAVSQLATGMAFYQGKGIPQDLVQAHMWLDICARRDTAITFAAIAKRDELAKQMTPAQLADAQRMARDWLSMQSK